MTRLDIPALRSLADQHAAQLREFAARASDSEHPKGWLTEWSTETCERVEAAADFLAAPRRDGEQ